MNEMFSKKSMLDISTDSKDVQPLNIALALFRFLIPVISTDFKVVRFSNLESVLVTVELDIFTLSNAGVLFIEKLGRLSAPAMFTYLRLVQL